MSLVRAAFPTLLTDPWALANAIDEQTLAERLTRGLTYHPLATQVPAPVLETHSLYFACVLLIDFYARAEQDASLAPALRDALYECRVAYTDLFYYCLAEAPGAGGTSGVRMDNAFLLNNHENEPKLQGLAPFELFYPGETERVFTGDDLPNVWPVVCMISLWGENTAPDFPMARIFSKTLPFSCQRRSLIPYVAAQCQQDPAFWRMFSRTMWCALTGLYPRTLLDCSTYSYRCSMDQLLRAKELVTHRSLLMESLTKDAELASLKSAHDTAPTVGTKGYFFVCSRSAHKQKRNTGSHFTVHEGPRRQLPSDFCSI